MDTKERANFISLPASAASWLSRHWVAFVTAALAVCLFCGGLWYAHRYTDLEELAVRRRIVTVAEQYLGCRESDGTHERIIDYYNTQEPLPRGYCVSYDDNWCAAFASAVAMEAGLTDIIPTECSCQQQIELFQELGRWREDECWLPRTGDYIYYVWDEWRSGDCTAWAEHVGIVVETFGPVIKVIEGNKDDAVGYRYIFLNDICIRGYGLPDYAAVTK